ncbi:MAG TPA: hypothetical protein VG370_28260 [Chloroflexota bacterium]|nr:hypothetical protein [Chloroflexota bacterium]
MTDDGRILWAQRVPQVLIRRLYESDARGLVDDELIDEVAFMLHARCHDILTATRAAGGEATCPRCRGLIRHRARRSELLRCAGCGWETTWDAYFRSYRKKQLHGGGALPYVREYHERLAGAASPREKMLLIDRLITQHHGDLRSPTRPVAVNLIEGTVEAVIVFLDGLSAGSPEVAASRERWRDNVRLARERLGVPW